MIEVDFGSTQLQAGFYRITETDAYSAPEAALQVVERARRDGNVLLFSRLRGRDIEAKGYAKGSSAAELNSAMDNLKKLMLAPAALKITEDSAYRQWEEAVLKNVNIARAAHDLTYAEFSLQFSTEEPFATSGQEDTLVNQTGITAGFQSFAISPGGTYLSYPVIAITVNTETGMDQISLTNPVTGDSLTIDHDFTAGDEISIDTFTRKAFLNGELISPEGRFLSWVPGSGTLEYADTASARNVDVLVTAERKWL